MISREELKGACSKSEIVALYHTARVEDNPAVFAQRFMYDEDQRTVRNALWVLTKATDEEVALLLPIRNNLVELAMDTDSTSVRRLAMTLVSRIEMEEKDLRTDFLDFCLERMMDASECPGIQSVAMKLALRMCSFYPELREELLRTLEAMESIYYKPAVRNARERILSGKLR